MDSAKISFEKKGLSHPVVLFFAAIMLIVAGVIYAVMLASHQRIIEHEAVKIAEVVGRQALAARTVYSQDIVGKLRKDGFGASTESHDKPGHVPIPAQFLKLLGKEASKSSQGLFSLQPISLWNLEASQGLTDEFQRWAWTELEKQDLSDPGKAIDWKPVWRFETLSGVPTLRYMRADPASSAACVNCHNAYETRPEIAARRKVQHLSQAKQWKLHQLMGALEIRIPVDKIEALASEQRRDTLLTVVTIALLGLLAAGIFAMRDLARKQALGEIYKRQAHYDPLTGMANRTLFAKLASSRIEAHAQTPSPFSVLFLDLDRFKTINDSLGHETGDTILRVVACRLAVLLPEGSVVARHSGDEFTAMVPGAHDNAQILELCNRLLNILSEPVRIDGRDLYISTAIGVSRFPQDGNNVAQLIKQADTAMYGAKRRGRGEVNIFVPNMSQTALDELDLTNALHVALAQEQFELFYQPVVQVGREKMIGVEALIRWNHPVLGTLSPDRFLPLAEELGLMAQLGDWALYQAMQQAADWGSALPEDFRIAVNVSPQQFARPGFIASILSALEASGEPASRLNIEITESVFIQNQEAVARLLGQCKSMGVGVSLDDFGTGYSSLGYLTRFPLDNLKIDRSFVAKLPADPISKVLVKAVIQLAHSLGLSVVAEGVETQEQLAHLRSEGCDNVQGYLYSKPVRADQIPDLLRRYPGPAQAEPVRTPEPEEAL